jgi:hypothetical protein
MDYLEFIARVPWHILDKSQAMVRYYNLHGDAHRGKIWEYPLAADPRADYFS